jgi:hypothetical protein
VTQKLTDMEIDRVDLVDAGANGRRFAVLKRDGGGAPLELGEGWLTKLTSAIGSSVAKALGIPEPVEKAMTFAQIVAGREMSDALEEHWTTLQDALWNAIYAYDDDNQPLPVESKKALVAQNLDEFKAFLLERMDQGIAKSDGSTDARLFTAFIAKVGKKVSAARLARLTEAADALGAVLAEVAADDGSAETEKRATPQEETDVTLTPEDIAAITKANEPLVARIEALETASKPAEPVTKTEGDGDAEPTIGDVLTAFSKLAERVEKIEEQRGVRTSASGEETVQKSGGKSAFAGVF